MTAQMDFFDEQEKAHRKTLFLVVCFALAVILIILAVYVVIVGFLSATSSSSAQVNVKRFTWWDPETFLIVVIGTLTVVTAGTLFKIISLRRGGEAVAGMLGGLPISQATTNLNERKALNVVEEMAIASGLPVPPVFLLPEETGINAFAAGFKPGDAVIGLTRGCINHLSRDELQGVIGHEFSHILNGDMRLNIRLIGILHGILLIGMIGRIVTDISFRSMAYSARQPCPETRTRTRPAISP